MCRTARHYFFHTGFGRDQSIRVDLGRPYRIRRIEVTNRQNGFQERAKTSSPSSPTDGPDNGGAGRLSDVRDRELPGGAWLECGIDLPDVTARFVTITSPMNTALHFST